MNETGFTIIEKIGESIEREMKIVDVRDMGEYSIICVENTPENDIATSRSCIICDKRFIVNSSGQKYCSDDCRYSHRVIQLKANKEAQKAIKKGLLIRKPCEVCGAEKVHAHHEDYLKPLEVRWLCPKHHYQVDAYKHKNI